MPSIQDFVNSIRGVAGRGRPSPTQLYQRAGVTAPQANAGFRDLVARNRANRVSAGSTQGYQPSNVSGGGGGGPAPSTLSSLPQTPELLALIKSGLIREGMPPEQALAILATSGLSAGVGVDVKALMDMIKAEYARTTGDITTAQTDWLQEILGDNAPAGTEMDALYAQDPMWANSASVLGELEETSDLNEATDLAWFAKMQEAQQEYYNGLAASLSTGGLPAAGGGGGGGGGGGYGGGGGGNGNGEGDWELGDVDLREKESTKTTAGANWRENNPGFWQDQVFNIPMTEDEQALANQMNWTYGQGDPEELGAGLTDEMTNNLADIELYNQEIAGQKAWSDADQDYMNILFQDYMTQADLSDDPNTPEVEHFHATEGGLPAGAEPIIPDPNDRERYLAQQAMYNQAYAAANQPYNPGTFSNVLSALQQPLPNWGVAPSNQPQTMTAPGQDPYGVPGNVLNMGPVELRNYLERNADTIMPDQRDAIYGYIMTNVQTNPGDTYWGDALDTIENLPEVTAQQINTNYAQTLSTAMQGAQTALQDPADMQVYLQNVYPTLTGGARAAVDKLLTQNGVSIPATASQPTPNLQQMQGASVLSNALQGANIQQIPSGSTWSGSSPFGSRFGGPSGAVTGFLTNPQAMQKIRDQIIDAQAGRLAATANLPVDANGNVRADLLTMLQDYSQAERYRDRQEFPGTNDEFEEEISPADYYNPEAHTQEDITPIEAENDLFQRLRDAAQMASANWQMQNIQNFVTERDVEEASLTDTASNENPEAFGLVGTPDPNTLSYDEIDIIPGEEPLDYDEMSGPGESARFKIPQMNAKPVNDKYSTEALIDQALSRAAAQNQVKQAAATRMRVPSSGPSGPKMTAGPKVLGKASVGMRRPRRVY